jgi:hypothetical protein
MLARWALYHLSHSTSPKEWYFEESLKRFARGEEHRFVGKKATDECLLCVRHCFWM